MEISPLLSTSLLLLSYHHAVLFLKRPITEKLNSPACVKVWERRGEYCSPSHKSSCAHKGKYLCWATAWQPLACLFFSLMFLLCCSCFHNPSSPCLSAWDPPLPLTPFSCTFSVSTTPSSSFKTLNSQQFLKFPPTSPGNFSPSAEHWLYEFRKNPQIGPNEQMDQVCKILNTDSYRNIWQFISTKLYYSAD